MDLRGKDKAITGGVRDLLLDPNERSIALPTRTQSNNPREKAIQLLRTIKGISPARAELLLTKFGTVSGVAGASVDQLAEIKGIGRLLASEIAETFQS